MTEQPGRDSQERIDETGKLVTKGGEPVNEAGGRVKGFPGLVNEAAGLVNVVQEHVIEVGEHVKEVGERVIEVGELVKEVGELVKEVGEHSQSSLTSISVTITGTIARRSECSRKKSDVAQEPNRGRPQTGFEIEGRFTPCSKGTEVIAGVFEALGRRDPRFFEKFAALPKHGRTRRYLARDKAALYPGHPELQPQSVEVADGWWLATHSSSAMKERIIAMACEVSGLKLGKEVKVTMP